MLDKIRSAKYFKECERRFQPKVKKEKKKQIECVAISKNPAQMVLFECFDIPGIGLTYIPGVSYPEHD
jgi:hypothetical protein